MASSIWDKPLPKLLSALHIGQAISSCLSEQGEKAVLMGLAVLHQMVGYHLYKNNLTAIVFMKIIILVYS